MQDRKWHSIQDDLLYSDLTKSILRSCFEVMNTLGSGFLESVYKHALVIAMTENGLSVSVDKAFEITFRNRKIGVFIPDLIVNEKVIIELKSCDCLLPEHQAQLINYLAVTNVRVGLLINFGKRKLEYKRSHHPEYHAACDLAYPVAF